MTRHRPPSYRRVAALVVLILVVLAGLAVHFLLPDTAVTDIAGDALYALAVYGAVVVVAPSLPPWTVAVVAGGWCVAVELFQLTGLPVGWAEEFPPVVLVLGTVFDARDLLVYVVVSVGAALVDVLTTRAREPRRSR